MSSREETLDDLARLQLLDILEWAAGVAFAHTVNDYDEDTGHDQMIIGVHNYVYFRDLLDRATSSGRYALAADAAGDGYDMISRGITPEALASMPRIEPGTISRSDYKGSPGWAAGGYRVLIQSFKYGEIDRIKWVQRSAAKVEVASQHYVGANTLFDDEEFGLESSAGIPGDEEFFGITLVAAHSYDPLSGHFELHLGLSKNPQHRGDSCWHWRHLLLSGGTPGIDEQTTAPAGLAGNPASAEDEEISIAVRPHIALPDVENG